MISARLLQIVYPHGALQAYCRQAADAAAKEAGLHGDLTFELAMGSDVRSCLLVFFT
jgi:hypothetical protein